MRFSIDIPVYNVMRHLCVCLGSGACVVARLKSDAEGVWCSVDVICVDDCSTNMVGGAEQLKDNKTSRLVPISADGIAGGIMEVVNETNKN